MGQSADTTGYAALSLWWDGLEPVPVRRSLDGALDVDVAIVGGGFTGLWTARSLLEADPTLRVVVVEKEVVGFGASGRNGGWCSALFAASDARIERQHGHDAAMAMRRAMQASVDEVGAAAAADGIDCRYEKGGTIVAARSAAQVQRSTNEIDEARAFGLGEEDLRWLDAGEATKVLGAQGVLGATFTPHCAAIDPARLVRGLADTLERRGVTILEGTEVLAIEPATAGQRPRVRTAFGTVVADVVVRALEGWTPTLAGAAREIAPVYSLMVATEPLPAEFWADAGLDGRPTFADHRHVIIYGQRTADDRIAFGGRGAPYHIGSSVRPSFDRDPGVFKMLRETLVELFPALVDARITHRWGGPVGVPRDWHSSVGYERESGIAWAGGYVGDGVSTTNLAGRTLADLIVGRDSELVRLPWVGHRSPRWEPEPLRWLGINMGLWATKAADRTELRNGQPSWIAARMERLLGG
jgi:glycine/D-amino acid oxidase-like deaminating enzyme